MSDPEYEAQFARGYTGPPIVPPAPRVEPEELSAELPAESGGSVSAAEPEVPPTPGPALAEEVGPTPAPAGRNPWTIAVLVASLAMVAAGCTLLRLYATTNAPGYGLADQTAVLLQSNLGAPLITAGIIGVIAWLILLALRGGARRGSP